MECHECGAGVSEEQKFCHECGTSLHGVTAPTERVETVPAASDDASPAADRPAEELGSPQPPPEPSWEEPTRQISVSAVSVWTN